MYACLAKWNNQISSKQERLFQFSARVGPASNLRTPHQIVKRKPPHQFGLDPRFCFSYPEKQGNALAPNAR